MTPEQLIVLGDSLREAGLDEITVKRMLAASSPTWLADYCLRVAVNVRDRCERTASANFGGYGASMAIGQIDLAPIIDSAIDSYSSFSISSYVEEHGATLKGLVTEADDEDGVDYSGRNF